MDVDLDHLMSPSCYSKKFSADVVVDHHIDVLAANTKEARTTLKCDLGLNCDPPIDIYYPPNIAAARNIFIYLHGGYWQALGLEHSGWIAIQLARENIILAAVGYDIAPKANMTTIVEQCRIGVAFVSKRFPDKRLFVGGHSAGGHLTAMMMITDWSKYGLNSHPFKGGVHISGVYDLQPIQKCYVNDPLQLTDKEVAQFSPLSAECSSLLSKVTHVPLVIAEGEHESPEFKRQRAEYVKLLEAMSIEYKFYEMENEDHFSVMERLSEEDYPLIKIIIDFIIKSC